MPLRSAVPSITLDGVRHTQGPVCFWDPLSCPPVPPTLLISTPVLPPMPSCVTAATFFFPASEIDTFCLSPQFIISLFSFLVVFFADLRLQ